MRTCQEDGCEAPVPPTARSDAAFCSSACRQRAYRRRSAIPANPLERAHQEAELVNAVRSILGELANPANLTTLSPKALENLALTLEDTTTTIRNAISPVTDQRQGIR